MNKFLVLGCKLLPSSISAKIVRNIPNKHSVYTTEFINDVIVDAGIGVNDLEKIFVVNGPGSFTGVRIGVTIAKVMAYLLDIDIICVSSLKMRALSINHNYCMSLIDAHHDNYYMGLYDSNNSSVIEEGFYAKDYIVSVLDKYNPLIVSDSDILFDSYSINKQELDILKIVDYYRDITVVNTHLVVPNYLKQPQALENLK